MMEYNTQNTYCSSNINKLRKGDRILFWTTYPHPYINFGHHLSRKEYNNTGYLFKNVKYAFKVKSLKKKDNFIIKFFKKKYGEYYHTAIGLWLLLISLIVLFIFVIIYVLSKYIYMYHQNNIIV